MKTGEKKEAAIDQSRALINRALRRYLDSLRGPHMLRKAMVYAVFSGGKRLRPVLAVESAKALGGSVKQALPFACAVEFIHNYSLVHDDLPAMDNDDARRGKPTCHKKFGEATAILAGNALLNLAFGLLSKTKHKKSLEAISLLSNAAGCENMLGGQLLDLEQPPYRPRRSANAICRPTRSVRWLVWRRKIDAMKTGALMGVSCKVGVLAAGGRAQDIKKLGEFGKNLGLAFQIADDLEDCRCGKSVPKEIRKGAAYIAKGKRCISSFGKSSGTLQCIADSVLKKLAEAKKCKNF